MGLKIFRPENLIAEKKLTKKFISRLGDDPSLGFISKLFEQLPELQLYLVGGMVRDMITDYPITKDYDFVARGVPMKTLVTELQRHGTLSYVGKNFGVIKFVPENSPRPDPIDIALPRTELPQGTGGYRDVKIASNHKLLIEDDLARRDLTINAMAWDIRNQSLIDPFNGQKDLADKQIRAVGNPEQRFQEDYSRMLRAIRFACKLDFEIEEKTFQAIKKLMPHINDQKKVRLIDTLERQSDMATDEQLIGKLKQKLKEQKITNQEETRLEYLVARETVGSELLKSLEANPRKAISLFENCLAIDRLLPEVLEMKGCKQPTEFHAEGDVWQHTMLLLEKIESAEFQEYFSGETISGEFVLGAILHDAGKPLTIKMPTKDKLDRIRFDGHDVVGAEIVDQVCERFKFAESQRELLRFMIKNNMLAMSAKNIFDIRTNKFSERFIDSPYSRELLMLLFLDCASSLRSDGSVSMDNFADTVQRIKQIKEIRMSQPDVIISGKKLLQTLGLKKGGPLMWYVTQIIKELADQGKINSEDGAINFVEKNKSYFLIFIPRVDDLALLIRLAVKMKKASGKSLEKLCGEAKQLKNLNFIDWEKPKQALDLLLRTAIITDEREQILQEIQENIQF
ncbi:hypothetical protein A2223_02945 [Candidatus Falkowbacteria bacterium RIFOXYA2_FULL_35_8]|uniref:HD domain-containing protein n=1 Tax=Candidatus Falkowbacteria bacterium RIFOXYC2_FULL_36_12 TaxID=1798002 RepID=A0A1F5SZM8_9BACT|nr:MAG: hypothetical protein A2300_03395 [Candidatus Falkowbacteria bacterium RIFOXYB2_FULL_35_7]OGF31913.1 MAG: hypothetical protein A2478_05545 [Candidatus Falkowbacteria bacterium RIFOXYC2_FULL_36_12]OGF34675.1 MAG: hypothetical protein A2223_02945 [Candidatus Falkowbacteria bacterium RIFOXYA2_FULL_35_8]